MGLELTPVANTVLLDITSEEFSSPCRYCSAVTSEESSRLGTTEAPCSHEHCLSVVTFKGILLGRESCVFLVSSRSSLDRIDISIVRGPVPS